MFASCMSRYHWRGMLRVQAHAFPLYAFASNLSRHQRVIIVTFASHPAQTGLRASSVTQPAASDGRVPGNAVTSCISTPAFSNSDRASSGV